MLVLFYFSSPVVCIGISSYFGVPNQTKAIIGFKTHSKDKTWRQSIADDQESDQWNQWNHPKRPITIVIGSRSIWIPEYRWHCVRHHPHNHYFSSKGLLVYSALLRGGSLSSVQLRVLPSPFAVVVFTGIHAGHGRALWSPGMSWFDSQCLKIIRRVLYHYLWLPALPVHARFLRSSIGVWPCNSISEFSQFK